MPLAFGADGASNTTHFDYHGAPPHREDKPFVLAVQAGEQAVPPAFGMVSSRLGDKPFVLAV